MPALITKYQEKVLVTSALKSYANVINAINTWCAKNETPNDYDVFWTSNAPTQNTLNALSKEMNAVEVCYAPSKGCGGSHTIKSHKKMNDGNGHTLEIEMNSLNRMEIWTMF